MSVIILTALCQCDMLISFVFYLTFGMVHPDNSLKPDVSEVILPFVVSPLVIKVVNVREKF